MSSSNNSVNSDLSSTQSSISESNSHSLFPCSSSDIKSEKKLLNDKHPTEVNKEEAYWLYARINNKNTSESEDSIDRNKVGKWMLFLTSNEVNETWDKIKNAIQNNILYRAKVSTTEILGPTKSYAIMIYTKDYTDIENVICVLDYLEASGIKPYNMKIYYKTDAQTRAGIYRGGKLRPWIYSSDTVRSLNTIK